MTTEDKLKEEIEVLKSSNYALNKIIQKLEKDNYNLKEQVRKEAIKEIKDKWIKFINNIPYSKIDFLPLLSVGHIRDSFLNILLKLKGEQNDN